MGRNAKITKHILANALRKTDNISEIARMLGIARINVYRAMRRWGLRREAIEVHNVTLEIDVPEPSVRECAPIQAPISFEAITKANLLISEFAGRNVGDVGKRRR